MRASTYIAANSKNTHLQIMIAMGRFTIKDFFVQFHPQWYVMTSKHVCNTKLIHFDIFITYLAPLYGFSYVVNLVGSAPGTTLHCSSTSPVKHES